MLQWVERGGPPLDAPPAAKGFGATLVQNTVVRQFSGVNANVTAKAWQ